MIICFKNIYISWKYNWMDILYKQNLTMTLLILLNGLRLVDLRCGALNDNKYESFEFCWFFFHSSIFLSTWALYCAMSSITRRLSVSYNLTICDISQLSQINNFILPGSIIHIYKLSQSPETKTKFLQWNYTVTFYYQIYIIP